RQQRRGADGLAAENPGLAAGQVGAPLLRHAAPGRAPGAPPGRGTGSVLLPTGRGAGGAADLAQPAGGPPRAGRAPGRRPGATAGLLPRSVDPAPPGGVEPPPGGPAPGPHVGQREKCVAARPGAVAAFGGRCFMTQPEYRQPLAPPAPDPSAGAVPPAE